MPTRTIPRTAESVNFEVCPYCREVPIQTVYSHQKARRGDPFAVRTVDAETGDPHFCMALMPLHPTAEPSPATAKPVSPRARHHPDTPRRPTSRQRGGVPV